MALSHAPVSANRSIFMFPVFAGMYSSVCCVLRSMMADNCLISVLSVTVTSVLAVAFSLVRFVLPGCVAVTLVCLSLCIWLCVLGDTLVVLLADTVGCFGLFWGRVNVGWQPCVPVMLQGGNSDCLACWLPFCGQYWVFGFLCAFEGAFLLFLVFSCFLLAGSLTCRSSSSACEY